jgi:hypothetical protein
LGNVFEKFAHEQTFVPRRFWPSSCTRHLAQTATSLLGTRPNPSSTVFETRHIEPKRWWCVKQVTHFGFSGSDDFQAIFLVALATLIWERR